MPTAIPSPTTSITSIDAQRVEDALSLIAPKWTTWSAQTLAQQEHYMRVSDVAAQLPFVSLQTVGNRLSQMHTDGLVTRPNDHHGAPYKLSTLGESLTPVHRALSDWSQANLGLGNVAGAERVEDAARRLHLRHSTTVIKVLGAGGPMRFLHICDAAALENNATLLRLKRLQKDGLVTRTGPRHGDPYVLTNAGQALGPVYAAIEHWSTPSTAERTTLKPTPTARAQNNASPGSDGTQTAAALRRSPAASNSLFSHAPQPQPRVPTALTAQSAPFRSR
ncbi:winged helix-turn-helix transcriptional regulator [Streptomyces brevispora]|uniref:winged helix-turn-helix transcriptional regulator n=1 Tax=Streptomyces brevispora TaxID=887462 RepID=UPI002E2EC0F7|nr:winged helix-turn-helix transcriptional regulator [Streptomyces brevispora]